MIPKRLPPHGRRLLLLALATVYAAADAGSNAWDNPVLWPQDTSWLAAGPWS